MGLAWRLVGLAFVYSNHGSPVRRMGISFDVLGNILWTVLRQRHVPATRQHRIVSDKRTEKSNQL